MAGATLDTTLAKVTEADTLVDSLIALTNGLEAQLKAAIAGGLQPDAQAKVDAIFDQLEAQKVKVAAAIAANTDIPPTA